MNEYGTGIWQLTDLFHAVGEVESKTGDAFAVDTADGPVEALRAVSCLVEPEIGDRVLVAGPEHGELYVLAVLARPGGQPLHMKLSGDVALGVAKGQLTLAADEGLHLASAKDLSITSPELRIRAEQSHLVMDRITHVGSRLLSHARRIKLVADVIDTFTERLSQRVKRSYRFIDEMDYTRAKEIDQAAEGNISIRGENTLTTARRLVKIDGEQIHVG
jgi:hypothetical protein